MFTGVIEGVGPRYCPSIEDKINRFADKDSHQIFVEPEGLQTNEIYPNGISTSLPFDIQLAFIRSMKGFEKADIVRPGYAIEYDFFDPRDLKSSLETKFIKGLFFAGQINGTTGYEEAAAQGLIAGANAALQVQEKQAWSPGREEAYIGVMIDDLITQGTSEPYRMFTSRAEYRLILREDNADLRLTEKGRELGLVDDQRWQAFSEKKEQLEAEIKRLESTRIGPDALTEEEALRVLKTPLNKDTSLYDMLRRPEVSYDSLTSLAIAGDKVADPVVAEQVEIQTKYSGYIKRQMEEIEKHKRYENKAIPDDFEYLSLKSLSSEVREKLQQAKPQTIGQAGRVPGVTPAAISLLLVFLKSHKAKSAKAG